MPKATLLEKAYGSFSAEDFETVLKSTCRGLKVKAEVLGCTAQEWIQVDVTGEDETAALQLLEGEFGLAPESANNVTRFSVSRGRIVDFAKDATSLLVDVGVFEPEVVYARIPLQSLQAQLADGEGILLQRLVELFCLLDYVPLEVKVVDVDFDAHKGSFLAELSETQLGLFTSWLHLWLDRLLVLGMPHDEVERALRASKHSRDVVRIESLGWLEHVLICKLGTDAVGLIPAIGWGLRTATLAPFSPRKLRRVVDRSVL